MVAVVKSVLAGTIPLIAVSSAVALQLLVPKLAMRAMVANRLAVALMVPNYELVVEKQLHAAQEVDDELKHWKWYVQWESY